MTTEEKISSEPLENFDDDDYDAVIEVIHESKSELVNDIDLVNASPRELLIYFADSFKRIHGYEYNIEWVKEVTILKSFKERYGINAGPMIALLFDKHKGKINDMVMTITAFAKGSKWIQDTLYIDLQQSIIKKEKATSSEGLLGAHDFMARFSK